MNDNIELFVIVIALNKEFHTFCLMLSISNLYLDCFCHKHIFNHQYWLLFINKIHAIQHISF